MLAANRLHRFVALLIALSLSAVFAACTPIMPEAPAAEAPPSTQPADPCPTPGEGQLLLRNETDGYCLLYPAAYTLDQTNPGVTDIVVDNVMNHWDPRLSIAVSGGRPNARRHRRAVGDGLRAARLRDHAPKHHRRGRRSRLARQPAGPGPQPPRRLPARRNPIPPLHRASRRRRQRSSPAGGDALPTGAGKLPLPGIATMAHKPRAGVRPHARPAASGPSGTTPTPAAPPPSCACGDPRPPLR